MFAKFAKAALPTIAASLVFAATPALAGPSEASFAWTLGAPGSATLLINGTDVITASNRGWVDSSGSNNFGGSGGNYIAGICGSSDGCAGSNSLHNNYFVFDVANYVGQVNSLVLNLAQPSNVDGISSHDGYISINPSETYSLWDISADPRSNSGVPLFNDLGSGLFFGSTVVNAATNGTTVSITLNANALSQLNRTTSGLFWLGGTLRGAGGVPEPSTWLMLIAGFGMIGAGMRRRARIVARVLPA